MYQSKATRRLRLHAESLERRLMLAGDVSVAVLGGNLRILGDNLDNQIAISETSPGTFQVAGLGTTTINNQPVGTPFDAIGVSKNWFIRMGDDSDSVAIHHAHAEGLVNIDTGRGDDHVDIFDAQFENNLFIQTDGGNDTVGLGVSPLAAPTVAGAPLPAGVNIKDNLFLQTGSGDDTVDVIDTHIAGNALIGTDSGEDHVSMGVSSPESAAAAAPAPGEIPPGDFNVVIGRLLILQTGADNDTVELNSVRARAALIGTGGGDDLLVATNSAADFVFISLGEGDDTLDASGGGNTVDQFVLFGGPGDDTLEDGPNNNIAHSHIFGVEHSV